MELSRPWQFVRDATAVFVTGIFMFPVFWYALLNSAFVTLRQGGIRWRGTFYSIGALRAGGVK